MINTLCASRLNEHVEDIRANIAERYHVNYECLFTYDAASTPQLFVPSATPKKSTHAREIFDLTHAYAADPICFELTPSGSFVCFDIIDVLYEFEHCSVYSNVTSMSFVQHDSARILILGYDCADD